MYDSNVVNARYADGDHEIQLFVCVPCCCQNPVAMAALERIGYRAVAFVDDDLLLLVVESKYVISRYGVAAVCNDISVFQVVVGEVDWNLAV